MILLSFKAGLRVAEIAGLQWRDVMDADGTIGVLDSKGQRHITVPAAIAKKGRYRLIPMHSQVLVALQVLYERERVLMDGKVKGRVIRGLLPGSRSVSPNTLQRYLSRLYTEHGFVGVTSHSGRRTVITKLARLHNKYGCSLMDVQRIAGHSDVATTEIYVELSDDVGALIEAI